MIQIHTLDCVHEMTHCAKNGSNRFRGAASPIREIHVFGDTILYLTLPYLSYREHLYRPILDANDSMDAVMRIGFRVGLLSIHVKGSKIANKSQFLGRLLDFPAKMKNMT